MPELTKHCFWLVAVVLLLRLVTMTLIPLVETTEPRYAEISRVMAESADWITPWYAEGQPFWGKPPLSFWVQALSIRWLGVTELASRLPSWIAMIGCFLLTLKLARSLGGPGLTAWSGGIFITMMLPYISAGAVMTDAYLALGVVLSVASFICVLLGEWRGWRWWFFVGLAVGLLAKGPVVLVLVGLPILLWALFWQRSWRQLWSMLPWFRGCLLMLALALPWYLMAEAKTPGFLDYFLVGEHYRRFVDPGWNGDMYGRAHDEPKGMIWLLWLGATFPWGLLVIGAITLRLVNNKSLPSLKILRDQIVGFLVMVSLAPMLFFTFASNILWTYVLPGLPAAAALFASYLSQSRLAHQSPYRLMAVAGVAPTAVFAAGLLLPIYQHRLDTEKTLVGHFEALGAPRASLYYAGNPPYSARFYSDNEVRPISLAGLPQLLDQSRGVASFIAVPKEKVDQLPAALQSSMRTLAKSKKFCLMFYDRDVTETLDTKG